MFQFLPVLTLLLPHTNRFHLSLAWTPATNAIGTIIAWGTNALFCSSNFVTISNLDGGEVHFRAASVGADGQLSDMTSPTPWRIQTWFDQEGDTINGPWRDRRNTNSIVDGIGPALFLRTVVSNFTTASLLKPD